MRTDDDGRHWDHGYSDQRLAGVLRSWFVDDQAGNVLHDSAKSLLEALDLVNIEGGCFALSDIEVALRVDELRQIIDHFRIPVMAWSVRSTYNPEGTFSPGSTVVWAAFMTKKQAMQWLPYFEKKFERRIENGDVFEVVKCPAPLFRMYAITTDPDQENWSRA